MGFVGLSGDHDLTYLYPIDEHAQADGKHAIDADAPDSGKALTKVPILAENDHPRALLTMISLIFINDIERNIFAQRYILPARLAEPDDTPHSSDS